MMHDMILLILHVNQRSFSSLNQLWQTLVSGRQLLNEAPSFTEKKKKNIATE